MRISYDYTILLLLFSRSRSTRHSRRDPREYGDIFVTYIRSATCACVALRGYVHVRVLKPPRLCGSIRACFPQPCEYCSFNFTRKHVSHIYVGFFHLPPPPPCYIFNKNSAVRCQKASFLEYEFSLFFFFLFIANVLANVRLINTR